MSSPAGVLVIDKPQGLTSHDVVRHVRRVSGVRRVGHAGTLDPLATGVLVVCVGWATRLAEYAQAGRKTYETTVRLGQTTTTYDSEGDVVDEQPVDVSPEHVARALAAFRGPIRQQAPAFSAIKRDGQPLYKLARRGQVTDLPIREVTIDALELLAFQPPDVRLRVACSPGTYVRSLAHDLGQALECGGHVVALRRTASGHFEEGDAVPLDALTPDTWRDHLLPPEQAADWPQLQVSDREAAELLQGRPIAVDGFEVEEGQLMAVLGFYGRMIGLVTAHEGQLHPHKMAPAHL